MKYLDIETIKSICDFSKGVYTLLAIARKKDNEMITNSQEIVIRRIIDSESKLEKKFEEIKSYVNSKPENFKIYLTFNPRDRLKAYNLLKHRFVDWDIQLQKGITDNKTLKVDKEYISCLQSDKARASAEYFMFDLDDKEYFHVVMNLAKACQFEDLKYFETQNGYHILFKPCDTRDFFRVKESYEKYRKVVISCELKRDALVCIGYPEKNISIKDMYYIDKSKIDSNDKRQIEYLEEFDKEVNDKF